MLGELRSRMRPPARPTNRQCPRIRVRCSGVHWRAVSGWQRSFGIPPVCAGGASIQPQWAWCCWSGWGSIPAAAGRAAPSPPGASSERDAPAHAACASCTLSSNALSQVDAARAKAIEDVELFSKELVNERQKQAVLVETATQLQTELAAATSRASQLGESIYETLHNMPTVPW